MLSITITNFCIVFISGKTAFEVCACSKIRKQVQNVSSKLQSSFFTNKHKSTSLLRPTQHDVDVIFKLAENPKCLYELQKRLQVNFQNML